VSVVLRGGNGEEITDRGAFVCPPGAALFRPPEAAHEDRLSACETETLNIALEKDAVSELDDGSLLFREFVFLESPDLRRLALRIRREVASHDGTGRLALDGLALELLAPVSRHAARPAAARIPHWLRRVRALLRDGELQPLSFAHMAAEAGVSPSHLSRAFRRHFGRSPADYARRVRVDRAVRAIQEGTLTLADVAATTGFVDQSHLGRAFRRELGMTPGELRQVFTPNGSRSRAGTGRPQEIP
jgi:AraC-like DNA-binding protein